MAAKEPSLYEVFLDQVIRIEAVQCHRAAVTDDRAWAFFTAGYRPGEFDGWQWSLDAPEEDFLGGPIGFVMTPVSLPMKPAWDAAVAAFKEFIKAFANGELIASGKYPATGVRYDLDPAEWTRAGLILHVRNGDLIEGTERTVRWSTITVRAAIPEQKLGRIDWDDLWKHETARREQDSLPNEKDYSRQTVPLIIERYGVASVDGGDLRRFKVALYRGDLERPKRTRPKE
jgi:hypothetical protein